MNKELQPEILIEKLSGKYAIYYEVYNTLKRTLFSNFDGIKIIPKTIYALIDSRDGLLGVIFWKEHGLEFAIKTDREDDFLHSALHLKYSPMNKMIILNSNENIDKKLIQILKQNMNKMISLNSKKNINTIPENEVSI